MRLTIRNRFTNRETTVDTLRPMTARRALDIRRRLCVDSCQSGDDLGANGPQDSPEEYARLADRAAYCVLSRTAEK
jgi:hypothetical protein